MFLFIFSHSSVRCVRLACVCVCLCERTFGKQAKQDSPRCPYSTWFCPLLSSVSDSCLSAFSENPSIRVLKTGPSWPAWIFLRGLWRTLPWCTSGQRCAATFSWIHFCWLVEVTQCLYAASLLTPRCLAYCSVMSGKLWGSDLKKKKTAVRSLQVEFYFFRKTNLMIRLLFMKTKTEHASGGRVSQRQIKKESPNPNPNL